MPRKVINSLKKQEDIKIIAHEIRSYKPREATFRKIIDYF
jgi:hypothetical protein